jgi:hypothetical protein
MKKNRKKLSTYFKVLQDIAELGEDAVLDKTAENNPFPLLLKNYDNIEQQNGDIMNVVNSIEDLIEEIILNPNLSTDQDFLMVIEDASEFLRASSHDIAEAFDGDFDVWYSRRVEQEVFLNPDDQCRILSDLYDELLQMTRLYQGKYRTKDTKISQFLEDMTFKLPDHYIKSSSSSSLEH